VELRGECHWPNWPIQILKSSARVRGGFDDVGWCVSSLFFTSSYYTPVLTLPVSMPLNLVVGAGTKPFRLMNLGEMVQFSLHICPKYQTQRPERSEDMSFLNSL